jgi:hypothetical protein
MFDDLNQKPSDQGGSNPPSGGNGNTNDKPNWPTPPPIPGVDDKPKPPVSGAPVPPAPELKEEKKGVEDMFAESEPAKPAQFQPKAESTPVMSAEEHAEKTAGFRLQKILTMVAVVCVLLLVVIGVYWGIKWWLDREVDPENEVLIENIETAPMEDPGIVDENIPVDTNKPTAKPVEEVNIPIETSSDVDTDQDGLSDKEERMVGSDPEKVDTDEDGLFDREEVKVYKTNPRLKDTDGDGFSDGDEVKNGYNPNGEGKLYSID